jgi:hypothetical protein
MLPPGSADRGARLPSNTPPVLEPLAKTKGVWVVTVHPDAAPHTLSADDVYALTAYIPSLNGHAPDVVADRRGHGPGIDLLAASENTRWKDRETG